MCKSLPYQTWRLEFFPARRLDLVGRVAAPVLEVPETLGLGGGLLEGRPVALVPAVHLANVSGGQQVDCVGTETNRNFNFCFQISFVN